MTAARPKPPPHAAPPQNLLPRWDLSALFAGGADGFSAALADMAQHAHLFAQRWQSRIAAADGAALAEAMTDFAKISARLDRAETYAALRALQNPDDDLPAHPSRSQLRRIRHDLLFFVQEICGLEEKDLLQKFEAPALAPYAGWIADVRRMRDHQLPFAAEQYRLQKEEAAEDAWRRMFMLTLGSMRCAVSGTDLSVSDAQALLRGDSDASRRRQAWTALARQSAKNSTGLALAVNTLCALRAAEETQRGVDHPNGLAYLRSGIDAETVRMLDSAAEEGAARTAHRFYRWKAKKAGAAALHPADQHMPDEGASQNNIRWPDAQGHILAAFGAFAPEMATAARRLFDGRHVDACLPQNGQVTQMASGMPYIGLDYKGSYGDVLALARQLGRALPHAMTAQAGPLPAAVSDVLAETAGAFAEGIVFHHLMDHTKDPAARAALQTAYTARMMDASVLRMADFRFGEELNRRIREKGEVSAVETASLWRENRCATLGPAIDMNMPQAGHFWALAPDASSGFLQAYIPAFGTCAANVLLGQYQASADKKSFAQNYLAVLAGAAGKAPDALFSATGADIRDPSFWRRGIQELERQVRACETLAQVAPSSLQKTFTRAKGRGSPANDNQAATDFRKAAGKKDKTRGKGYHPTPKSGGGR